MIEGAMAKNIELTTGSGDYCNAYNIGEPLIYPDENKEGSWTGFAPPSPFGSWQVGDKHEVVCQADGGTWGQELRGATNSECTGAYYPCGMQHYVSFYSQGLNDHPWSGAFGEPSLVISAEADPQTATVHSGGGAWGYICPLLRQGSTNHVMEYCLEQWRTGSGYEKLKDVFVECIGTKNYAVAESATLFAPNTTFATKASGSAETYQFETSKEPVHRTFTAYVTRANLLNAIRADNNSACKAGLSENTEEYALVGVEQGMEGGSLSELGGHTANMQLYTSFTPRAPEVSTESPTSVGQTRATLNGKVTPNVTDTKYYFQYGETTAYGSSTSEVDAGAGTNAVGVNATISSLQPGTTYHYRVVAINGGGTSYGLDQTFGTAETSQTVEYKPNGETLVWYRSSGGTVAYWVNSGEKWYPGELGGKVAAGTSPAVEYMPNGQTLVYYVNSVNNGISFFLNYEEGKWSNGELGGKPAAAGTSPTVEYKPNGETLVWYTSSSGTVAYLLNSGEKWYPGELGGKVAAGTSPTMEYKPNGQTLVYYVNSVNNGISFFLNYEEGKWSNGELAGGAKVAAGTSPTMEYKPNGQTLVYYVNSVNNGISFFLNYEEGKWSNGELGGKPAAAGTSPTVEYKPNGETLVWYTSSSGTVAYLLNSGEKWYPGELGGKVAAGTSPTMEYKPNGQTLVYYINSSTNSMWDFLNYSEGKWSNGEL